MSTSLLNKVQEITEWEEKTSRNFIISGRVSINDIVVTDVHASVEEKDEIFIKLHSKHYDFLA